MAILYQYQCQQCNKISEHLFNMDDCPVTAQCPFCQKTARKIISIPGSNLASESPDWVKSIREIVEKGSDKLHCNEFLKNPTRDNYKKWMKGEGVRHIEAGEKPGRPAPAPSENIITDKLLKYRQEKRSLCLSR